MSFADANSTSIRAIEETQWGTTPTSGSTREIRLTSSSLGATKETTNSEEIRSDRMVSNIAEVSAQSGGDINFEFSSGAQDDFLAAFLMGAWTRPMTMDFFKGTSVSITGASEITISGKDVSDYFQAGRRIKLKGFDTAGNNGYFSVDDSSFAGGDTVITVEEATLTAEAGKVQSGIFDANDVIVLADSGVASTTDGFTGSFGSAISAGQLRKGQTIHVSGLGSPDGFYTIKAVDSGKITTTPAPGSAVTSGDPVTIKGSMVRNPSDVAEIMQRSFSIETAFNDVGQFQLQDGMVPGTFSVEVSTGSIITGTIGFQGRETKLAQTEQLGKAPYDALAAQTGEVITATTNVGSIRKDGSDFGAAIQSISLSGEANLRQQAAIGSKFAKGIGAGRFDLTGSMSVYFEDESLFKDFLDHATVSLSFRFTDAEGQVYVFTLPAVKFTADQIAPEGIDQDVMDNVEFTAFRDPDTECMLQIDRFSPA